MSISTHHQRTTLRLVGLSVLSGSLLAACVAQPPGLSLGETAGAGGSSQSADGGSVDEPSAGSSPTAEGGEAPSGADGGDTSSGAQGGTATGGSSGSGAGTGTLGEAGQTAQGSGGTFGVKIESTCPFHTDAVVGNGGGGTGGAAGSGGTSAGSGGTSAGSGGTSAGSGGASAGSGGSAPATTVTLQVSPFVGSYLADSAGRSLYTYGSDLPGDCHTAPVSLCVTDCLVSWPVFPAGARLLPTGLDDHAFGAILRSDGVWQTTYFGWPLYYYKSDLTLGQVSGQGKGKTWHLAQQKPPGVVILARTGVPKYLADGSGHTLYVSAGDQVGSADQAPVSTCTGSCLATFEPFHQQNFSVVTSLSAADFAAFVAVPNQALQVTYKGMPLYRAATDLKSGDMTGTATAGFTVVAP